jgi:hypothetical protein
MVIPPYWQRILQVRRPLQMNDSVRDSAQEKITEKLVESPTFNNAVRGGAAWVQGLQEGYKSALAEGRPLRL